MTNVTGTISEAIYVMPAAGAALTSVTKSVLSANTATNPPCQLAAPLWLASYANARALHVTTRGVISTAAAPGTLTFGVYLDPTQNSTTSQILLAGTGALTPPISLASGEFELEFDMTTVSIGISGGVFTGTVFTGGVLTMGPGNNAATTAATTYMVGAAAAITWAPGTQYFLELWAQWGTAPGGDSIQCTQFIVQGSN